jgi:hypothetical protein
MNNAVMISPTGPVNSGSSLVVNGTNVISNFSNFVTTTNFNNSITNINNTFSNYLLTSSFNTTLTSTLNNINNTLGSYLLTSSFNTTLTSTLNNINTTYQTKLNGGTYSSITSNSSFTIIPLLNKRPGSNQQYITTLALPNPSLYSIYFTNSDLVVLDDINLFTTFYTKTETDSLYGSLAQQNTWSNTNNFTSSTYFYKDVNIVNNQSGGSLSIVPLTNGQPTTINFYTNTSRSALSAGNLWTVGNTNNSFIIHNNNIGSTIAINQTGDVNIPTGLTVSGVNYNTLVSTSTLNTTLTSYPTNTIFNNAMT